MLPRKGKRNGYDYFCLKIGHVFYMLCHGRKDSQLSISSAENILFCQQESLVKVYNYEPGTVQKAVTIRAAYSSCLLSNPLSKGQKEKGKRRVTPF